MTDDQKQLDMDQKPLLMLIDGHALVHRAYHALPPLTTKAGEPVGAAYGFASTLMKALEDLKPTHVAIAFDRPTPTFRHLSFEDYKAQREAAPDDLRVQFKRVRELVQAFGIPIYEIDGYEADDILGTLSKQASERGIDTIILTGDTDTVQLAGPRVRALVTRGMYSDLVWYDEAKVKERYGVGPEQIPDFKGLVGDSSDNIPGVPRIGEKAARHLLQQFGSVDEIYKHLDEIQVPRLPNAEQILRENEAQAKQSVELARIVTDVPLKLDQEACSRRGYNRDAVVDLFRELEFFSLLERLPEVSTNGKRAAKPSEPSQEAHYVTVATESELAKAIEEMGQADIFAFDTETDSLNAMEAQLVGLSLSAKESTGYYIPVGHQDGDQLPVRVVLEQIKPLLEDPKIRKAAHNANFDMTVLETYGVSVQNMAIDTMVAAFLAGEKALGLKALAFGRYGIEMTPIRDLIGKGAKQLSMDKVGIGQVAPYACADADITFRLAKQLEAELRKEGLWKLLEKVEMPLVPILVRMQRNGVKVDVDLLTKMGHEMGRRLAELESSIYEAVGHRFNINSSQQLGDVLFKELRLPSAKRTKSGFSTDASVLEGLRGVHPVIDYILEYRQITKLKSTYVDALPQLINPKTGRIHTTFNQTGSVTGRVSSNDPNLQNIPVRTEMGAQIRDAFVAEEAPDWLLLAADYSQIDLRVLAHISQDRGLIEAFQRGEDIHAATASQVYGVSLGQVTPDMRRIAKVINFGIVYGISGYGLASRTDLSQENANAFIDSYFQKYPGVREYMEMTKRQAKERGYVETVLGRRRYFPEITSSNFNVRMAAERMAINMPIQGTSAEIVKLAMIELQRRMDQENMKSKMLLQVHDELIFEVPREELEDLSALTQEVMPQALELRVSLKVDLKSGYTWGEME